MIKVFVLPIILLFGAIPPAISISNHGQMATSRESKRKASSYEVAIFGDIWGEGALKFTCLRFWGILPTTGDLQYEQRKCNKASAEIEFAKREFPEILSLTKTLKYKPIGSGNTITTFNNIQVLKRKCSDKTAIRAAKTARYWGTTEVGAAPDTKNTVIEGFSDINAEQYGIILEACEKGSWLDQKLVSLQDRLADKVTNLGLDSDASAVCDALTADKMKKSIGNQYIKDIQAKSGEYREMMNELDALEMQLESMTIVPDYANKFNSVTYESIYTARERLKKRLKACNNALVISQKHSSDNQKARKARERVQRQFAIQRNEEKAFDDALNSVTLD